MSSEDGEDRRSEAKAPLTIEEYWATLRAEERDMTDPVALVENVRKQINCGLSLIDDGTVRDDFMETLEDLYGEAVKDDPEEYTWRDRGWDTQGIYFKRSVSTLSQLRNLLAKVTNYTMRNHGVPDDRSPEDYEKELEILYLRKEIARVREDLDGRGEVEETP